MYTINVHAGGHALTLQKENSIVARTSQYHLNKSITLLHSNDERIIGVMVFSPRNLNGSEPFFKDPNIPVGLCVSLGNWLLSSNAS